MSAKDYYKGAYRITIQGVPCRVTVKPTPHMLALWRLSAGGESDPSEGIAAYNKAQYAKLAECREAVDWSQPGFLHRAAYVLEAAGFSL